MDYSSTSRPIISIVIPALNAEGHVAQQLAALENQTFHGDWEVIVADNGSTDATPKIVAGFAGRIPSLRVIDASATPGAGPARNAGAEAARAPLIAFCDADDVAADDWLAHMVEALEHHHFVAGAMDHETLNSPAVQDWGFFSHVDKAPIGLRFLPFALTANVAMSAEAFHNVGGFSRMPGAAGEDVDLSWKLQLSGYPMHFEPRAIMAYRHREGMKDLFWQRFHYGEVDPALFRRFRSQGMRRSSVRNIVGAYVLLGLRLHWLLSRRRRGRWIRAFAYRLGRIRGSLRERSVYL